MGTDRRFDGIYSNKVLQHLTREELEVSLHRQAQVLNSTGVLLHSLWYGDKGEEHHSGLLSVYYTEDSLAEVVGSEYDLVRTERYTEMDENDSIYFVLRKKQ